MSEIIQQLCADLTIMPDARVADMKARAKTFPEVDHTSLTWAMMTRRELLKQDVRTYRRMGKRVIRPLIAGADAPTLACMSMAIVRHNAIRHVTPERCRELLLACLAAPKKGQARCL